jgi:hypothetical protein
VLVGRGFIECTPTFLVGDRKPMSKADVAISDIDGGWEQGGSAGSH